MDAEKKSDANVLQAVPFFAVADMEASLRFYIDGVGFRMTKKWIDEGKLRWCWLEIGHAALMLQEFKTEGHDAWKPEGKKGEGVTIYFQCIDARAIYREVTQRGLQASPPFIGNDMWVTSLSDPDGYRIEFESPVTEAAESPVP